MPSRWALRFLRNSHQISKTIYFLILLLYVCVFYTFLYMCWFSVAPYPPPMAQIDPLVVDVGSVFVLQNLLSSKLVVLKSCCRPQTLLSSKFVVLTKLVVLKTCCAPQNLLSSKLVVLKTCCLQNLLSSHFNHEGRRCPRRKAHSIPLFCLCNLCLTATVPADPISQ